MVLDQRRILRLFGVLGPITSGVFAMRRKIFMWKMPDSLAHNLVLESSIKEGSIIVVYVRKFCLLSLKLLSRKFIIIMSEVTQETGIIHLYVLCCTPEDPLVELFPSRWSSNLVHFQQNIVIEQMQSFSLFNFLLPLFSRLFLMWWNFVGWKNAFYLLLF